MRIVKPIIAVIDDSSTNRQIYARLSRKLGIDIQVKTFEDPQHFIDWLSVNQADLIITDYKMPVMSGDKLIAHIRASNPNVPIIVVTAYHDRNYRVASLEA
ncbi:MAG: response regulator, partial [Rhodospirillales bacterium]|nr:response regulator [Rhodospirillales bacterium]